VLDCKNQESNVDTTHEPSDSGVPIETNLLLGTRGISCVIKKL